MQNDRGGSPSPANVALQDKVDALAAYSRAFLKWPVLLEGRHEARFDIETPRGAGGPPSSGEQISKKLKH